MSGVDTDPHALAANIRDLKNSVESLRNEGRDRGDKLEKILTRLVENQTRTNELSRRVSIMETDISSLKAWKWRVTGALSVFVMVLQWFFSRQ